MLRGSAVFAFRGHNGQEFASQARKASRSISSRSSASFFCRACSLQRYAKTKEECETLLEQMITEVKARIAAEKAALKAEQAEQPKA